MHRLGRLDPARDRNAEYVYGNASRFCALIRSVVTSAVPDLAEALKDQVKHVRRAAADALGKILSGEIRLAAPGHFLPSRKSNPSSVTT